MCFNSAKHLSLSHEHLKFNMSNNELNISYTMNVPHEYYSSVDGTIQSCKVKKNKKYINQEFPLSLLLTCPVNYLQLNL